VPDKKKCTSKTKKESRMARVLSLVRLRSRSISVEHGIANAKGGGGVLEDWRARAGVSRQEKARSAGNLTPDRKAERKISN